MGTWGSGNLDNDTALDELGDRSADLVKQLWTRLQTQESWEADEWAHAALFVDFEVLFALEAGGVFNGWTLPPVDEFDAISVGWLAGWGDYFEGMGATEAFAAERRAVIDATFSKFRDICAKYQAQRSG